MVSAASVTASCGSNIIFSGGGGATNDENGANNSSTPMNIPANKFGDQSINCYDDDIEEVIVYGYITSFGFDWLVIGINWALGNLGGGSGKFTEADNEDGCDNLSATDRMDMATLAFVAARNKAIALRQLVKFMVQYPRGSTFVFKFPDGSVGRYRVAGQTMGVPITEENSCG